MDMIEVNTSELVGPALDWATVKADEGHEEKIYGAGAGCFVLANPSSCWEVGGPLIHKYAIAFAGKPGGANGNGTWLAYFSDGPDAWEALGDLHLVAACRAIVAAKLGAVVSVPRQLMPA